MMPRYFEGSFRLTVDDADGAPLPWPRDGRLEIVGRATLPDGEIGPMCSGSMGGRR